MLQSDESILKQKLYYKEVFELVPYDKELHQILSTEDAFGIYRIIREEDPEFNILLQKGDYFNEHRKKIYGGIPIPFVARMSAGLENSRMHTLKNKRYEINTIKK